ncbi:Uu.00g022940.m01.CDS01 [Anthostomella pinea]|uniref:Uu.00g022940.m01.CDS01 n=1 Tax=Anthostomella pinea TaxID=933095 RepID=A0AAI8W0W2_9PEZI|nr:Uu.00g022940.m01.CDS01 [Anthostomella pinea]
MAPDLKALLTPALFTKMVETWIPYKKTDPIEDFDKCIQYMFFESATDNLKVRDKAWPALIALSELGLDNVPDTMSFLPLVESPDFPEQAFGLMLFLDQAPRLLLQGVDTRWTYAYFGEIALKFALQLEALPADLRPSAWARWKDFASMGYFVWVRLHFGAPIIHHEKMGEEAAAFTEETRSLIERHYGVHDPYRDQPEKRWDLYGFPNMLEAGGPKGPCSVADGCFWLMCLMDVHKPPLDKYGRYPYQNWRLGRVNTPEEDEWMDNAGMFRAPSDEVTKKIREDVEKGIWTPIGSGKE